MIQSMLFPDDRHDPGGKVRTRLPPGMFGDAAFRGDREQYRPVLRRWVGQEEFPDRWVCFIGMNPSTASAEINDPTITREWGFTVREGYSAYVKHNVSDYRATDPKELLRPGLELESHINRHSTLASAAAAELCIVCWGSVNRALRPMVQSLLTDLREWEVDLWCFGKNADGSPKHPLYLPNNAKLVRYE
jgi:hypothetical protein